MAEEQLLNTLKCNDTNGAENSGSDSGIDLLRRLIQKLHIEKERLLTLRMGLDGLSEGNSGYPLSVGGGREIRITLDDLSVQAYCLEENASLVISDVEKTYDIIIGAFPGVVSPEIEKMRDTVEEYRASAMKLAEACCESARSLRQMKAEYERCDSGALSGFDDFPAREILSSKGAAVSPGDACPRQSPVVPVVLAQAACAIPAAVPMGGVNVSPATKAGKQKTGFLGLFKRGKNGAVNIQEKSVIPPPQIDCVQFSAIAANRVVPGKYLPISIVMYEEAFRKAVDDIVRTHGENAKEAKSGYHDVERNSLVRVVLSSSDIIIEDNEATQKWNGKYLNFEFAVKVPKDFADDQILLSAAVYINDLIATKLKLILDCEKKRKHNICVNREDIVSAFVSYASQDRSRVASIIQGMKKARPDLDIFFDIESLRSGQRWEEALKSEIENRDVLFLCWSKYARESKWVDMEWRYALESKGEDAIEPIPIESPDVCPPPVELQQKHFNDKMLFIIKAPMPPKAGQPYLMRIKTNECMAIDKAVVRIGKEEKYVDLTVSGNAAVSRCHANIIFREGNYYIVDLNSTNRTYVDGQVIPSNVETPIKHGSKISLANEEFEFVNSSFAYQ